VTFLRLDRDRRQSQLVAEPARRNKRCPLWQCALSLCAAAERDQPSSTRPARDPAAGHL